jgi:hypothetical protein
LQAAEKDAADASTKRPADADEGAASLNATEVLMLNTRLKMIQERAAQANKAALEAEKERDELHNPIEQIEQRLHPKRARSHEDGDGDAHEMLPEVDNWDLRVHRQQATRVQNRRNVQVGSRKNQPEPWQNQRSLSRHHARQGAHIDRKNHVGNASGSALASHLFQQGLGHGARRHEDSAGCFAVSQP